jgi:glycosyltransferase involved in cell wall biosynthesis
LRLLIVCDYSLEHIAGAQTALLREAAALQNAGHTVVLVASDVSSARIPSGVTAIEPFKKWLRVRQVNFPIYFNNARVRFMFKRIADDFKPDAVICHSEYGLATAAARVFQAQSVPVIFVVHSFFLTLGRQFWLPNWFARILYWIGLRGHYPGAKLSNFGVDNYLQNSTLAYSHLADAVVSPSKHQAVSMLAAGTPAVEVISNVTDSVANPQPMPPIDDVLKFVWVGRLAPEKRIDVALEALALARRQLRELGINRTIELQVVGGVGAPAEGVTWHGRVAPSEVADIVSSCHALMLTSYAFDNQPMVILEAFADGRPVVVSDPKLAIEFGDGAIGAAAPDAAGLAKTLVELAQNPELLLSAAVHATEHAVLSASSTHVAQMEALIATLKSPERLALAAKR